MDPLPFRQDRVDGDRLLGERMTPAVAITRLLVLFEELLCDGAFECCEHCGLVGLRHLGEQSVLE